MKLRTENRSLFGQPLVVGLETYAISDDGEIDVPIEAAIKLLGGSWKKAPGEKGPAVAKPVVTRRRPRQPKPEEPAPVAPPAPAPEVDLGLGDAAPKRGLVDRLLRREGEAGESGSEE